MSSSGRPDTTAHAPFLRKVVIRGYKSLGSVAVELKPLTILVGRNGSGKSNFLDALRFIADSLQVSLDHAVKSRGGISEIRTRGPRRSFSIGLELDLPFEKAASYELTIVDISSGDPTGYYAVRDEVARIYSSSGELLAHYDFIDGRLEKSSIRNMAPPPKDRLYVVTAAGYPEFRAVYDALVSMGFYDFNPESMKSLQPPDSGDLLRSDGSNIASVLDRMSKKQPQIVERIAQYLEVIVPGLVGVERVPWGPVETLRFKQLAQGSSTPEEFFSWSMSDGTLRVLGSLVAGFQFAERGVPGLLVGIEEPENSLHPAATAALADALLEASSFTQILITSHSADLVDHEDIEAGSLLSVVLEEGRTKIAPIDPASSGVIREHLYTPGELLRLDQLEPDREDLVRQGREPLFTERDEGLEPPSRVPHR
jgi:predicted ATPase